jgi:hypothetical protein
VGCRGGLKEVIIHGCELCWEYMLMLASGGVRLIAG